jgi:phosphoglycerate kinase
VKAQVVFVVIGGGDCGACADNWGYASKLTHVSTGGGTSLGFLHGAEKPEFATISEKP